MLDNSVYIKVC